MIRVLALNAAFVLGVLAAACGAVVLVALLWPTADYWDVVAGVAAGWAAMELLPDPPCPFPCCRKDGQ